MIIAYILEVVIYFVVDDLNTFPHTIYKKQLTVNLIMALLHRRPIGKYQIVNVLREHFSF